MLPSEARIYVATTPIDMRRSFDGLAAAVAERMKKDPKSGALFVFINASHTRMKVLWFEPSGYSLLYKRLDRGVFRLPEAADGAGASIDIDANELIAILAGIDLPSDRTSARKIVREARERTLQIRGQLQQSHAR